MPPKKLVYITRPITPPWNEGSKNLALSLATCAKPKNFNKYILTTKKKFLLAKGVKSIALFSNPQLNYLNKIKLAFFLIKNKFDVFHFIFVATPLTSFVIKLILFIKKAKSVQTVVSLEGNPIFFGSKIVCFSKITARKIKQKNKDVEVLPPGVDIHKFRPGVKKNKIAFLGELYRTNSYEITAKLAKDLAQDFPHFEIIMGFRHISDPKNEPKMIKKLKKELKNFKNIRWVKTIKDMPKFLKDTKIIIFPSEQLLGKFDYPLVLIEGLSCGVPAIVSPVGPLLELSDVGGIVNPDKNTAKYFLKKVKLTIQHEEYAKLSKMARKEAVNNFSIEKSAKKYEKIYSQISS